MARQEADQTTRVRFGAFELDVRSGELRAIEPSDGESAILQEQPFRILQLLIERNGDVATREDIRRSLWPDERTVDFNHSINVAIATLRRVLDDPATEAKYIETVARRGYRLIPAPAWLPASTAPALKEDSPGLNHELLHIQTPDQAAIPPAYARERKTFIRLWVWPITVMALLAAVTGVAWYWKLRPAMRLAANDTVVLADISNQTSDPVFEDALNTALRIEFEQTPYFNLLGTDKVRGTMKLLGYPDAQKVTPENAREVCLRSNSVAVIASSIADAGNRFRIEVSGIECRTGKTLASSAKIAANRKEIVATLGQLGEQLRRKMGEPSSSVARFSKPLNVATSDSLEALQLLTTGYRLHLERDKQAASYYQRAIDLDPKLALAYIGLGAWHSNFAENTEATAAETKAFHLRDRLTGPTRFLAETLYYSLVTGDLEKAYPVYLEWVQTFPLDVRGHINFSFCALYLGQLDRAVTEAREAVRLLPSPATYGNLIQITLNDDQIEAAKAALHEAEQQGTVDPFRVWRHFIAFLQGNQAGMREQAAWAENTASGEAAALLYAEANAEAYAGRFHSAAAQFNKAKKKSIENEYGGIPLSLQEEFAIQEAEAGQAVDARELLPGLIAESKDRNTRLDLAMLLARVGETEKSKALADALSREYPLDTLAQNYALPVVRAAIQLEENDPAGALKSLRPTVRYELSLSDTVNSVYPAYLRGLAYLQMGKGALAIPEFQKVIDHPGVVGRFVTGALARLQLARAQAISGDKTSARNSYQEFFAIWKDADHDVPVYRQAKVEYSRLD
ncbi:DNA-binding winged helix-turn-helix (wHTH) protein/tetratricopeptide (TPR) repeat protein [Silvibacterium bohemicum]|uniref:DNA-binding winged helix-turn-helix (WHTH) protein/tetratricopeptide (TPR) repeat protein n=1 Tax=Silvibacterium bohemicum TaxID=1577686 RepID=A0A841JS49_9BACT|nr:winged helix-turn-helix domain-containing protein [Silvibacterium bohemicum]MBB6144136.1 DNA-binding winged helix-turn-helix (wHTH) protein/tetratricopeptide (TPR) repeat protein [Silvibacterium bohemicum]